MEQMRAIKQPQGRGGRRLFFIMMFLIHKINSLMNVREGNNVHAHPLKSEITNRWSSQLQVGHLHLMVGVFLNSVKVPVDEHLTWSERRSFIQTLSGGQEHAFISEMQRHVI